MVREAQRSVTLEWRYPFGAAAMREKEVVDRNKIVTSWKEKIPNSFKSSWICFSVRRCLRDLAASALSIAESWKENLSMARVARRPAQASSMVSVRK